MCVNKYLFINLSHSMRQLFKNDDWTCLSYFIKNIVLDGFIMDPSISIHVHTYSFSPAIVFYINPGNGKGLRLLTCV